MQNCKIVVFKCYLWYYEYKKLFCDYLRVNLFNLIELQQLTYCNGEIVNNFKLRGYNKDFQKEESLLINFGELSNPNKEKNMI